MIVEYCDKCGADIRKNDGIGKAIEECDPEALK